MPLYVERRKYTAMLHISIGIGIGYIGQYYWILGGFLGIVLTLNESKDILV